jgi:hypothetical protein
MDNVAAQTNTKTLRKQLLNAPGDSELLILRVAEGPFFAWLAPKF